MVVMVLPVFNWYNSVVLPVVSLPSSMPERGGFGQKNHRTVRGLAAHQDPVEQ